MTAENKKEPTTPREQLEHCLLDMFHLGRLRSDLEDDCVYGGALSRAGYAMHLMALGFADQMVAEAKP